MKQLLGIELRTDGYDHQCSATELQLPTAMLHGLQYTLNNICKYLFGT